MGGVGGVSGVWVGRCGDGVGEVLGVGVGGGAGDWGSQEERGSA